MHYSKKYIKDKWLIDIKMPGSHNSNTYTFKSVASFISKNQTITL